MLCFQPHNTSTGHIGSWSMPLLLTLNVKCLLTQVKNSNLSLHLLHERRNLLKQGDSEIALGEGIKWKINILYIL